MPSKAIERSVTDPDLSSFLAQSVEPNLLPYIRSLLISNGGAFACLPPQITVIELVADLTFERKNLQRNVGLAALEAFVDPTTAQNLQVAGYNAAYYCGLYGCTQIEDEVLFLSYLPCPTLARGCKRTWQAASTQAHIPGPR